MARAYGRGGGPSLPQVPSLRQQVASVESQIRGVLAGLGGTWQIELAMPVTPRQPYRTVRPRRHPPGRQPSNAEVLSYFVHGTTVQPARNVLVMTPSLERTIVDRISDRWSDTLRAGGKPNLGQILVQVAYLWKEAVVARLSSGGGDLSLTSLSASWRERKQRLGYPSQIGKASGQLLEAVRKAQPVVRRR